MKVIGLDGRRHVWTWSPREERASVSAGHERARGVLWELFPMERVLEEVYLPGCGEPLYVDFLVPRRRLIVEVQGRQHQHYVPHFHRTLAGFRDQLERDEKKRRFAGLNNWRLVELWDWEAVDEWRQRILNPPTTNSAVRERTADGTSHPEGGRPPDG